MPAQEYTQLIEEIRVNKLRLDMALKAARLGIWDWNVETGVLTWNKRMHELFDVPRKQPLVYQDFTDALHVDDVPRVQAAIDAAVEDGEPYEINYRVMIPGGTRRIHARGLRYPEDPTLPVKRLIGVCLDGSMLA